MNSFHIKKEWRARGYSCNEWSDAPGTEYANLVEEKKIIYVIDGTISLTIQGTEEHLVQGDERIIAAGVHHTIRNSGEITNRWLFGYEIEDDSHDLNSNSTLSERIKRIFMAPKQSKIGKESV